jgi:hypothetical protein
MKSVGEDQRVLSSGMMVPSSRTQYELDGVETADMIYSKDARGAYAIAMWLLLTCCWHFHTEFWCTKGVIAAVERVPSARIKYNVLCVISLSVRWLVHIIVPWYFILVREINVLQYR